MNKCKLIEIIDDDIGWRVAELASVKSLHLRNKLNEKDSNIVIKANIPLVYAIWEGFVVGALTNLVTYLNSLQANINDLDDKLVTHFIDGHVQLHNARASFDSKCKQVDTLRKIITEPVLLSTKINTESNVNLKVLNKLLMKFNISCFDSEYKDSLNKLLMYRNSIAHGESAYPVNTGTLNELGNIVQNSIYLLRDKIEDYVLKSSYLSAA